MERQGESHHPRYGQRGEGQGYSPQRFQESGPAQHQREHPYRQNYSEYEYIRKNKIHKSEQNSASEHQNNTRYEHQIQADPHFNEQQVPQHQEGTYFPFEYSHQGRSYNQKKKTRKEKNSQPKRNKRRQTDQRIHCYPEFRNLKLIQDEKDLIQNFYSVEKGSFFLNSKKKNIHFIVDNKEDLIAWYGNYLINGFYLKGIVIKARTLTADIYLFMENTSKIFNKFIGFLENGYFWKNVEFKNSQIFSIQNVEKVELCDNNEPGYEGLVCFIATERSYILFSSTYRTLESWYLLQRKINRYTPTSVIKIYLDQVNAHMQLPESLKEKQTKIAVYVNPNFPGETVQFSREETIAFNMKGFLGSLATQFGIYSLVSDNLEILEDFVKRVEQCLDIAEEFESEVMIPNLEIMFSKSSGIEFYLPEDPILKIVRSKVEVLHECTDKRFQQTESKFNLNN